MDGQNKRDDNFREHVNVAIVFGEIAVWDDQIM
jgi:hypothetical protein